MLGSKPQSLSWCSPKQSLFSSRIVSNQFAIPVKMSKQSLALVILVVMVACSQLGGVEGYDITYFKDVNHKGAQNTAHVLVKKFCVKLNTFRYTVSSFDTHDNCILIFTGRDCNGASYRIAPGTNCHHDLRECGMNDKVASFYVC